MATNAETLSHIEVTDIFDELMDENIKLKQCLNVLIQYKSFVDLISNILKSYLDSNDFQKFEDLNKEMENVLNENQLKDLIEVKPKSMPNTIKKEMNISKTSETDCLKSEDHKKQEVKEVLKTNQMKDMNEFSTTEDNINKRGITNAKNVKKSTNNLKADIKQLSDGSFKCPVVGCGSILKNRQSLSCHKSIHSETRKRFVCDINGCDYWAFKKNVFENHMNKHKDIKPYKCDICGKCHRSAQKLRYHKNREHITTDHLIVCQFDGCNKEFNNEDKYKSHYKTIHLISEPRFSCPNEECEYKTKWRAQIKYHFDRVHLDIRPFTCPVKECDKRFKDKSTLKAHKRIHTNERNFICVQNNCNKTFKTAAELKKPQLCHSDVEYECDWPGCDYKSKYPNRVNIHRSVHTNVKNIECTWPTCHKRFRTPPLFNAHMRIHRGDKRFACLWPGCSYRCTDSGNLCKHKKQVHLK